MNIETIYGTFVVNEPVFFELIESSPMQRLKNIHMGGSVSYVSPIKEFYRYDHCLGVFALMRLFQCPIEEQVAGLLHDSSHTIFSHVGDCIFNHQSETHSYQDDIHHWFLEESGLKAILERHGISLSNKLDSFAALDQELPNLCADRIDYNLQNGFRRGLLEASDVQNIINDLRYENKQWFFLTHSFAKQLALISLLMTETVWGTHWGLLINLWTSEAIKQGMKIDLISFNDIHFSTDDEIWNRLNESHDPAIKLKLKQIFSYQNQSQLCDFGDHDLLLKGKFRGVDPWIKTQGGLKRLTEIDLDFSLEFFRVKKLMISGWPIKFLDINK